MDQFKRTIEAYRNAARQNGHDPAELPVATAGFFYAAETTRQAQKKAYARTNKGMKLSNINLIGKEILPAVKNIQEKVRREGEKGRLGEGENELIPDISRC